MPKLKILYGDLFWSAPISTWKGVQLNQFVLKILATKILEKISHNRMHIDNRIKFISRCTVRYKQMTYGCLWITSPTILHFNENNNNKSEISSILHHISHNKTKTINKKVLTVRSDYLPLIPLLFQGLIQHDTVRHCRFSKKDIP